MHRRDKMLLSMFTLTFKKLQVHIQFQLQVHSQDFQKGGYMDVWCVCMHEQSMNHISLKTKGIDVMRGHP